MKIYKDNLIIALRLAIKVAREEEKNHGYTKDSGLAAGWVELENALVNTGEPIYLI